MRLERLKLLNFRNLSETSLTFPHRANLLVGPNGAGKTNLLEAINYLSFAKSHRGGRDRDLVRFGEKGFRIEGDCRTAQKSMKIEISFTPEEKRISLNSGQLAVSELVGNFPVVPLSSNDIETTRGMPALRRRFIDMILSFLRASYFAALMSYRRVLRQRNRVLVDTKSDNSLYETIEAWNAQLVEYGSQLIESRSEFAGEISRLASRFYSNIAPGTEDYELIYHPSVPLDHSSIENSFLDQLRKTRNLERERGVTLVGPHRDDFLQKLGGRDLRRFASEGQQRTASMSMKLAGAELVRDNLGDWPVVLFDEVFAELDHERCTRIAKVLEDLDQVFIATAKRDTIPEVDLATFFVDGGSVDGGL